MSDARWQFVRIIPWPYPGLGADAAVALLAAADGKANSFSQWPALVQAEATASMNEGVKLGCVDSGYASLALFGTATATPGQLELRLIWPAPT